MQLQYTRFFVAAFLVIVELLAISASYQLFVSFECQQTDIPGTCRLLRGSLLRVMSMLPFLGLFLWLRPGAFSSLMLVVSGVGQGKVWLGLHGIGVGFVFLPLALFRDETFATEFATAFGMMSLGSIIAGFALLRWLATLGDWLSWISRQGIGLPVIVLLGLLTPDLANMLGNLWNVERISQVTFSIVRLSLEAARMEAFVDDQHYVIGANGFYVQIAAQCSGVEGFALVTTFMIIYAALLRRDVVQSRYWLIVFPLALISSWVLNVVRISTLIIIGAKISPEHAQNGFHSYAGWLLFTLLAFAILMIVHVSPSLHRKPMVANLGIKFSEDWAAARILPFGVMMLSGVVAATFWPSAEIAYPLRAIAMGVVIWVFRKAILARVFQPDALVLVVGLAIGVYWATTGLANSNTSGHLTSYLGQASSVWVIIWVVSRLIGTTILVPLIEELFFRAYILKRLDLGGTTMRGIAIVVSSGLFGLLHARWLEGFAAGVIFALLYLRRSQIADAIIAHAVANTVIAIVALWFANWAII